MIVAGKQLEQYASADNDKYQLFEIKGDKQPIGIHWEETPFTSHSVSRHKGDTFYLFSDGFIDQFGGEDRKKFKTLNFKKLLLSVQEEFMDQQMRIIESTFNTWCGEHEQIDDVSVFGIKV
jgi:serine phosphatase RsbU (regulator of sigma subunit)